MRKLLLATFGIIIALVLSGGMAMGDEETYIKVGLSYGYNEISSTKISCQGGLALADINGRSYLVSDEFPDMKQATVFIEGGKIKLADPTGSILFDNLGTEKLIIPLYKTDVIYAGADGYRGGFCFHPEEANKMNLINFVEIEDYVKGVVHSEIGQSSPLETIKAQAVCARSYALSNLLRHNSSGYDICATTHCQVYKGYKNEFPSTNRACDETKGLVLYYKGEIISAYYSKNDGGFTDNVEDVWGKKQGFLRGIRDEFSPVYKWEKTYTFDELTALLNSKGYKIGKVSSIVITGRNQSGTVAKVSFWDEKKQVILTGSQMQSLFGGNTFKSTMFSFSPIMPEDIDKAREDTGTKFDNPGRVTVKSLTGERTYSKTLQVIGKEGIIRDVNAGDLTITDGKNLLSPPEGGTEPDENIFTPIINLGKESQLSSPVTFYGLGWGHNVGMAQDSIIAMGKLGYDFEYMLHYFFTDISIGHY